MAFVYLHYLTIISPLLPVLILIVFKPLNTKAHESFNSPYHLIAMMANSHNKNMNCETDEISAIHSTYSQARSIRTIKGHDAALPMYRSLLERNKRDFSAALRIAASSLSPSRHDGACPIPLDRLHCPSASSNITITRILELRTLLARSRYDNKHVQNMFGIRHDNAVDTPSGKEGREGKGAKGGDSKKMNRLAFAQGPVYIKPVSAGNGVENTCTPIDRYLSSLEESDDDDEVTRIEASFQCLVTLFLLGFSEWEAHTDFVYTNFINAIRLYSQLEYSAYTLPVVHLTITHTVPKDILLQHLFGGQKTITLLEQLGLAYPCEVDPGIIVPYVHIFPLDIDIIPKQSTCRTAIAVDDNHDVPFMSTSTTSGETYEINEQLKDDDNTEPRRKCILLVTDCHPTILSRTTVGTQNDGAVMYIGPDSLALVQHVPLKYHIAYLQQHGLLSNKEDRKNQNSSSSAPSSPSLSILDFCTGSGVQAISTLVALEEVSPNAKAVCVDVNDRALRFAKFNSLLNGIEDERLQIIKADLIYGELLDMSKESATGEDDKKMEGLKSKQKGNMATLINTLLQVAGDGRNGPMSYYDIILANPPFIPVPPLHTENNQMSAFIHDNKEVLEKDTMIRQTIAKRYGLFSSGGSNGEEVLRSIITMSSRLLRKEGGLLAIVSEFMNPPTTNIQNDDNKLHEKLDEENDDDLCRKVKRWWTNPSPSNVKIKKNEDEKLCSSNNNFILNNCAAESKGILFTNQYPVDANTYAYRRADNKHECEVWSQHLDMLGIHSISPGLMYIQTFGEKLYSKVSSGGVESGKSGNLDLDCRLVPKSDSGSVWTPYNERGVFFTRSEWTNIINKCE